ncbi:MAG: SDR family oxidoreductase [Candidatus Latescibacteria bacterium]|nr:SDR family oxidoreductase [Candidatus Latescibacterota bacterium]
MGRLDGKVAVITGGGQGIGRTTAVMFAWEGARVVVADMRLEMARQTAQEVEGRGGEALALQTDVTDGEDVRRMVAATLERFGQVDVLVNNAGVFSVYSTETCPEEEWDRIFRVNVKGVFLCSRAVMGPMRERKTGAIINLSSLAAKTGGLSASPPYSASKAAVACYTWSLAKELAPHVRVNAVAPGIIDTEMTQNHPAELVARTPLGRKGRPQEVASAILFLASDESSFITGEIMNINGGLFMD